MKIKSEPKDSLSDSEGLYFGTFRSVPSSPFLLPGYETWEMSGTECGRNEDLKGQNIEIRPKKVNDGFEDFYISVFRLR